MNNKETRQFAIDAHKTQMYGIHPYSFHLDMVAEIVAPFGITAKTIAYLHDVLEDTEVTAKMLQKQFDSFITKCVSLISDEKCSNRQERKLKTNEKLSKIKGRYRLTLIVKAADRLANVLVALVDNNARLLTMYKQEHETFKVAVYRKGLCDYIWMRLDNAIESIDKK